MCGCCRGDGCQGQSLHSAFLVPTDPCLWPIPCASQLQSEGGWRHSKWDSSSWNRAMLLPLRSLPVCSSSQPQAGQHAASGQALLQAELAGICLAAAQQPEAAAMHPCAMPITSPAVCPDHQTMKLVRQHREKVVLRNTRVVLLPAWGTRAAAGHLQHPMALCFLPQPGYFLSNLQQGQHPWG